VTAGRRAVTARPADKNRRSEPSKQKKKEKGREKPGGGNSAV